MVLEIGVRGGADNVEPLASHGWGSISIKDCESHYDCGPFGDYKMFIQKEN